MKIMSNQAYSLVHISRLSDTVFFISYFSQGYFAIHYTTKHFDMSTIKLVSWQRGRKTSIWEYSKFSLQIHLGTQWLKELISIILCDRNRMGNGSIEWREDEYQLQYPCGYRTLGNGLATVVSLSFSRSQCSSSSLEGWSRRSRCTWEGRGIIEWFTIPIFMNHSYNNKIP